MKKITYNDSIITIDKISYTLDFPIQEAFEVDGVVVVLYDSDSDMGENGQFKNLFGLKGNGEIAWVAELPTEKKMDVYYKISHRKPLIAYSFSSYECEIDINNGKIIRKEFDK